MLPSTGDSQKEKGRDTPERRWRLGRQGRWKREVTVEGRREALEGLTSGVTGEAGEDRRWGWRTVEDRQMGLGAKRYREEKWKVETKLEKGQDRQRGGGTEEGRKQERESRVTSYKRGPRRAEVASRCRSAQSLQSHDIWKPEQKVTR